MHELGIVFHIIRTVEDVARQNDVTRIQRVTLQLGEVSGVVESYLQDCWKWAAAKSELLPGAVLTVETIPAVTVCEDCGQQYPTVQFGRTCPHCQSQMYGCEEPPADQPILVDVVLEGADGTRRVLPYPDEALRRGGMEEGDSVELTDGILRKV